MEQNNLIDNIQINDMLLQSGSPIFIQELGLELIIHQPKLIDIARIGGYESLLYFYEILEIHPSIEELKKYPQLKELDVILLTAKANQNINKIFYSFLEIFFEEFKITESDENGHYVLCLINRKDEKHKIIIDNIKFMLIKQYIEKILYVNKKIKKEEYTTKSSKAKEIKEKMMKGRKIREKIRNKNKTPLFNSISSFSANEHLPINYIYENYTLFQFYSQYERFNKKNEYEYSFKAMIAGAKDIKLPDWQGGI